MTDIRSILLTTALLPMAMLAGPVDAKAPAGPDALLTLTLGGDMIGPYAPRADADRPPAARAVAGLFRTADLGFANQEGSIFDRDRFAGHAASENGGGYPLATAAVAATIRDFGIAIVSKANNHATDFGTTGLLASLNALAAAGVASAGAGPTRAAACAPVYVERPGGTVALISAASTFPPMAAALAPVETRAGPIDRPGICALHTRLVELVTPDTLTALRAAAGSAALTVPGEPASLRIGDQIFRTAAAPGHRVELDPADAAIVLAAIAAAHARGALVMLAVHAHETAGNDDPMPPADFEPLLLHRANEAPGADDPMPASFEPELFHQAIAAGADIVVRTGPHGAQGVELHHGKPIFWGMGSLVFAFGGRRSYTAPGGQHFDLPADWFTSIVATVRFEGHRLARIDVRPVALASSKGAGDGEPSLIDGAEAAAVFDRFQANSRRFGTAMAIAGGVATLRIQDR